MDIDEALTRARAAIEQVEPPLPEDLRGVAFTEVLRHFLGSPSSALARRDEAPTAPTSVDRNLAKLATRIKVPEQALADIFDIDDDGVRLHITSSRIDPTKSRATREVSLLIVAARQGAGIDDAWTPVAHVRDALQSYNRYDASNFSTNLRACGDVFNIRGKGTATELRLTQPGWEAATALIRAMAGASAGTETA